MTIDTSYDPCENCNSDCAYCYLHKRELSKEEVSLLMKGVEILD